MKELIILILGYFIGSITKPVLRFIYSEINEKCTYPPPHAPNNQSDYKTFDIVITKYFNKTIHVSCHWYKTLEYIKHQNISYKYCPYGARLINITSKNRYCPFTKIKHNNKNKRS